VLVTDYALTLFPLPSLVPRTVAWDDLRNVLAEMGPCEAWKGL